MIRVRLNFFAFYVIYVALLLPGCNEGNVRNSCEAGNAECSCFEDQTCNEGLSCVEGTCEPQTEGGSSDDSDASSETDSSVPEETDSSVPEEGCEYTCSVHCRSIGGSVKDGTCTDDLQCCDLPESEKETDETATAPDIERGDWDLPHDMFVGNITTFGSVRQDFLTYWDQITPENEGKWEAIEGNRDNMNWRNLETIYNFAKDNNIPFKQHTMVWGNQSPRWINNLSSQEQAEEIEEWIEEYCKKFPDTDMMDVVNEAIDGHAPAQFAHNAFGNDWIVHSFELAHQYCPNTVLILNDYNVLRWNTQEFMQIAKPVADAGLLDAVGCQAHGLGGGDMGIQDYNELKTNLDTIASLGVPIYISEYDIEQTDDNQQLEVMKEQFPLFYEHPSVVGITYWGYIVGRTWRNGTGLMQENGTPRPALDWLMDYLNR